jgi:ABC-2 type transport system permease protein
MNDAFTAGACMIFILAAGTLGALAIVSDYASGLARTTFAAVPARRSVVAAKASVLSAVMLAYGAVIAAVSFALTQTILSGRHIGLSIEYPGALRAVVASALLAPVCAMVGLGLGALLRYSAASVVATVVTLLVIPSLLDSRRKLTAEILHTMPHAAWNRLTQSDSTIAWVSHPAPVSESWTVYAAWALGAVIVAMLAVHRRDL